MSFSDISDATESEEYENQILKALSSNHDIWIVPNANINKKFYKSLSPNASKKQAKGKVDFVLYTLKETETQKIETNFKSI